MMQSKYRGCLLGVATCDALGATVEFQARGSFETLTGLSTGGKFDLRKGEWTDDTSMTVLAAESILLTDGFHPHDQMQRFAQWYDEGHLSATGECFDIGKCTLKSLQAWRRATKDGTNITTSTKELFGPCTEEANGNGTLMRLAAVPLAFRNDPAVAVANAERLDKSTHGGDHATSACRAYTLMVISALSGANKETVLNAYGDTEEMHDTIKSILVDRSYASKPRDEISAGGWVVPALEAALWAFYTTETFVDGALACANLGDDADTIAAIYGALAGAFYGEDAVPEEWLAELAHRKLLVTLADSLLGFAEGTSQADLYKGIYPSIKKMEEGLQRIVSRSRPGPRGYKSAEECTAAITDYKNSIANTEHDPDLAADFVKIAERYVAKVEQRCR